MQWISTSLYEGEDRGSNPLRATMTHLFTDSLLDFMHQISRLDLVGTQKTSDLCNKLGIDLPAVLENSTIREATKEDKPGSNTFTISTTMFGWLMPWLAKTKCVLICVDLEDGIHCLHLCVTCLDGWPGPGCYIHGSWN